MSGEIGFRDDTPAEVIDANSEIRNGTSGHAIIDEVVTNDKLSKTILREMDIAFPENTLTAILGPSGELPYLKLPCCYFESSLTLKI